MISKTVATTANTSAIDSGKNELTEFEYATKFCQLPQTTPLLPGVPQNPKRSATADRKEKDNAILKKSCEKVSVLASILNDLMKQKSEISLIKNLT